jgi:vancomycin permeability regulator SanA
MSFFDSLGSTMPQNGMQNILQRFQQFQRTFTGNPQQQVQQLLNSGKVTQQQYQQAVQMAQQLQRMMGGK